MASTDTAEAPTPTPNLTPTVAPTPSSDPKKLVDLPIETQKAIIEYCGNSDLICLSLVSRHFRDLAAAQLYRVFHIVFPDEDDPDYDSPIDGLAAGLDTFVTSDYDYARHLRDLSLDTLIAGDKAEMVYKPYLYNASCGKFMNTLLLMTLRKAKSLESFRWNIRVELSRPVYRAMHQIDSLRHLHVRLQAGPSLYETPPALPFSSAPASTSLVSAAPPLHDAAPPSPPPAAIVMPSTASSGFYVNVTSTSSPPPPVLKSASRSKSANKSSVSKEPPTLSGFKDLQTLAVLDIDTLDVVTELKSCVRNSAGTLHKLKLSFSDALGRQARKPPPAIDPDDSDQDDDFQVVPLPASSSFNDDASEPAKVFRAQEERKNQESVLGRIFDVEPYVVRKSSRKTSEKKKEAKEPSSTDPGEDFIAAIKDISTKLVNSVNGNSNPSQAQQEILDTIAKAATLYVAANAEAKQSSGKKGAKKGKKGKDEEPDSDAGSRSSSNPTPVEESKAEDQSIDDSAGSATELFADKAVKRRDSQTDLSPDDIDIEEPEEQLVIDHQEPTATELAILKELAILQSQTLGTPEPWPSKVESAPGKSTSASTPSVDKAMANLAVQRDNFMILVEKLEACELRANRLKKEIKQLRSDNSPGALQRLLEAEKQMISSVHTIESLRSELNTVDAEIDDAEKQIPPAEGADVDEVGKQRVTDYLRTTRGMAVRSLHIYLIPVKASVLSRALDLRVLERLTLLNVGTQAPIWTLLHKENAESPLPLRKIFTDNVSQPFLNFVSQLPALHDFFILERMEKYKPESFAPKTTMTIDHIRRLVFKKHMATLKRVMVKNQNDTSWDFDERTVALVCRRGRQLEELACSMGIKTIHKFMQQLNGLVNLRALHIVQLRNDDTCVWVMRETRRFLIDNVSHHPDMKLEFVSIDEDKCEQILRPAKPVEKEKSLSKKAKGKQKAMGGHGGGHYGGLHHATHQFDSGNEMFPVIPPIDTWDVSSESEDEDDLDEPRIETTENVPFHEVYGIKIFEKEILGGRL